MPRPQRRQLIAQRLKEGPVTSQEELAAWLSTRGLSVTQATISRDFRAIGVVKGPGGYALPDTGTSTAAATTNGAELDGLLIEHAQSVETADSLVVIKTAPGHAGLLASALDRWPPPSTVGTIAGDDTIFIATPGRAAATKLAARLGDRAGLDGRRRR